jgi:hypothetical protein
MTKKVDPKMSPDRISRIEETISCLEESIKCGSTHLDLSPLAEFRDSAATVLKVLSNRWPAREFGYSIEAQTTWGEIGNFYLRENRLYEAIAIFDGFYLHLLKAQDELDMRIKKGTPLVWMSECLAYSRMKCNVI